jgi:hypothetical protein
LGGSVFIFAWLVALLSGCLVTDQIELPPVSQSPPLIKLTGYEDPASVIKFDRDSHNELLVNLDIRDEDLTETLKVRWRIVSRELPPGVVSNQYPCKEPEIVGKGSLIRSHLLKLQGSSFARGKCHRIDVIVSASFKMCKPDRPAEEWDMNTQEDDDADIGRLSFWVWVFDASNNPLLSPDAALALAGSCPAADYQPPSPTATTTSATTPQ